MISRTLCYASIEVREIVASPTRWKQSPEPPDPERKLVLRRLKKESGQAQLHCFRPRGWLREKRDAHAPGPFTAIEQGKRRFEKRASLMSTHISTSSITRAAIPDRTVFCRQLEENRSAFHVISPKESRLIFAFEAGSWFAWQIWILWISYYSLSGSLRH